MTREAAASGATGTLAPARLRWHGDQPFAENWGDIYHAPDGAAEVARVFLAPSAFAARVTAQAARAGAGPFRIGELGFGSGLNFVVAAEAALASGCPLQFVSFEAEPIAPADFAALATRRAAHHPLYAELARHYPPLVRGWHQRHLAGGRIRLSLYWGDAAAGIAELEALQRAPLDAWFLDGFAPDRNPELWTEPLFAALARLSGSGTTVATFTAAGRVRRGLEQAGFAMRRVDQRPHKRESLAGTFARHGRERRLAPARAVVVGAGLAGASAARHLAEAGLNVTVYDPLPPVAGAGPDTAARGARREAIDGSGPGSHVPTTVLHGRLLADAGPAGMLRCHAFLYAAAWAARFPGFRRTGVLQLPAPPTPATDARSRRSDLQRDRPVDPAVAAAHGTDAEGARLAAIAATWGDSGPWLQLVRTEEARRRTGWPVETGGLWFETGGIVDTPRLCAGLLDHAGIEVIARAYALPETPPDDGVPLVLACGIQTLGCSPAAYLELATVHGQLDYVAMDPLPRAPIVGNGYLAPGRGLVAAGATYEYRPWETATATARNLAQLAGRAYDWRFHARGTRTVTSDRVAIAGLLHDVDDRSLAPLYVSTGHGSMGNVTSHFAGALVAAAITGDLPPMSPALVAALSPLRFRERQRRRGLRHGARSSDFGTP